MPLDRVLGESFRTFVGQADGQRGRSCVRSPPPEVPDYVGAWPITSRTVLPGGAIC